MENDEIEIIKIKDKLLEEIGNGIDLLLSGNLAVLADLLVKIQNFQPSPQLLDKHLNNYIGKLCQRYDINSNCELNVAISNVFYQFTKVRGYKTISNCLSSDVYLIESIMDKFAQRLDWKENFFLLLWLSILVLNPFELKSVDSMLPQQIYDLGLKFSVNNSKELDVAAILMSRFLSRSDNTEFLRDFYNKVSESNSASDYLLLNYLKILNNLLKIGQVRNLESFVNVHNEFVKSQLGSNNLNILKYSIKNLGKLSEFVILLDKIEFLEDIINFLISKLDYNSTVIRYCVSRQLAKICLRLDLDFQQELFGVLLQDLEIPNLEETSFTELQIDSDLINVNKYHGTLLALLEFCNSRIIQQQNLPVLVSILHKTFFLEQNRLTYTVGSNIRDLTCYIAWSLLKKYKNLDLHLLKQLFQDLILTTLFDKDIMIRRSASAVMQELIGRFGDFIYQSFNNWELDENYFKLKLIEKLDFVVLGDIKKSFSLSEDLVYNFNSNFKEFFISQLYGLCFNDDYDIRKLSTKYFVKFINLDKIEMIIDTLVLEKNYKPGLFYLLAELVALKPIRLELITNMVSSQTFNSHKESFTKGEEILYIISTLISVYHESIFKDQIDLIFSIIRVSNSKEILSKFSMIIDNLSETAITEEIFDKLIYHIKMGNNLVISRSISSFHHLDDSKLNKLIDIIEDEKQDSDVRSSLIESLSVYLSRVSQFDQGYMVRILNQLDDYTITSQGDVGSRLRLSTIRLILQNFELLRKNQNIINYINLKLVRLNFDMIDKIRHESFELFVKTFNLTKQLLVDEENYFDMLLNVFKSEISIRSDEYLDLLKLEFCKGYSFLSGGVISSNKLIQDSMKQLIRFMGSNEELKLLMLNNFSIILSKTTDLSINFTQCQFLQIEIPNYEKYQFKCKDRLFKLQNSTLILFQRFFEWNVSFPDTFEFKSLFIKVFNLQLNQQNQTRLKACFKLFKMMYLSQNDVFFNKGKTRLIQLLCTSQNDRIRLLCSEVLYELYHEQKKDNSEFLKILDDVDWTASRNFSSYSKILK